MFPYSHWQLQDLTCCFLIHFCVSIFFTFFFFLSRILHITLLNFRDFLSCSASFLSCSASLTKTILSFIPILWSTSGLALPAWSCVRTHILHSLMSLTFLESQSPVRLTFIWYLLRVSWKIIYGLSFNSLSNSCWPPSLNYQ